MLHGRLRSSAGGWASGNLGRRGGRRCADRASQQPLGAGPRRVRLRGRVCGPEGRQFLGVFCFSSFWRSNQPGTPKWVRTFGRPRPTAPWCPGARSSTEATARRSKVSCARCGRSGPPGRPLRLCGRSLGKGKLRLGRFQRSGWFCPSQVQYVQFHV